MADETIRSISEKGAKYILSLIKKVEVKVSEKVDKVSGKGLSTNDYTDAEKTKLAGIVEGANKYTHPSTHPASMISQDSTHRFVTDTEKSSWDGTYEQSTAYTDQAIANLIGGAPSTMDTLKEVADAIAENESVVEALDAAIGVRAKQTELDTHTGNSTVHITASERTKWNKALAVTGDSADNTVKFATGDSASPTAWSNVAVLTSGEKHGSIMNKISTMFKNVRYLYKMLGTTDISAIGDGTATGAISALNTKLSNHTHSIIKLVKLTTSYTVSANSTVTIELICPTYTGYTPIGVVSYNTSNGNIYPYKLEASSSMNRIYTGLRSVATSEKTATFYCIVLYVVNNYYTT